MSKQAGDICSVRSALKCEEVTGRHARKANEVVCGHLFVACQMTREEGINAHIARAEFTLYALP